ncbi:MULTISPECIES: hypothetical protein [Xanthomonas]|uniref:Uncharacterized protein n=1 Tax=Xanthomonas sacchari TaxID=56458 RepID=A0AA46SXN1_9XANT|nr:MULTISPECIES: hypothetical protein [Xanthomonas]MDY4360055.1 hypothetical protein [Xanthomonas sp. LF04-12]UYK90460.1 hypothetical protein NG824_08745 [Xanthomonas sacchari]
MIFAFYSNFDCAQWQCKFVKNLLVIIAAVFLISGCGRSRSEDAYYGLWSSRKADAEIRQLRLGHDMKFEVKAFPAAVACSDSTVLGDIDGGGAWEYDAEDGRILLDFSKITNGKCKTPYAMVIFDQPGSKLAAFSDVEMPSSGVVFEHSVDGRNRL